MTIGVLRLAALCTAAVGATATASAAAATTSATASATVATAATAAATATFATAAVATLAVTNATADTREWGLLPDKLYLVTADLEPGEHALNIGGRSYVVDVPATGQVVAVVPSLAPGGATTITAR